jgi:hypothetical protein
MSDIFYILVRDDDGHWYVIPDKKLSEWQTWLLSENCADGVVPKWAVEVGGAPMLVKFKHYQIGD